MPAGDIRGLRAVPSAWVGRVGAVRGTVRWIVARGNVSGGGKVSGEND